MEFEFPFLKLPFLCIQCVLLNSHVFELISFSFASKRSKRILKLLKKTSVGFFKYHKLEDKMEIVFLTKKGEALGSWYFNFDSNKSPFTQMIDGKEVESSCINSSTYPFLSDDAQQSAKSALDYLMTLFKEPICHSRMCIDTIPESHRKPILLGPIKTKYFTIEGSIALKNKELEEVLENITAIVLTIQVPINPDFLFNLIDSEIIILCCHASKCLTQEALFSLNSIEILAYKCDWSKVNSKSFVDFFDRWFNSDNTTFKNLVLTWDADWEPFDRNLLNAYEVHNWDPNRRSCCFQIIKHKKKLSTRGLDIKRKDGLWASIVSDPGALYFHVWHDSYPDVEGRVKMGQNIGDCSYLYK